MTVQVARASFNVLLAGGGTGGHIYPNVAIAERILQTIPDARVHFLVSNRSGDATIMQKLPYTWSTSCVQPLFPLRKPWKALPFTLHWLRAVADAKALLQRESIRAVITSGGFVSGPAMIAARKLGLPRAMLNLDAVPGKANRQLVGAASAVFTVHPSVHLGQATIVGLPLRQASLGGQLSPQEAREKLGLFPTLRTLFITGATHGATSIIDVMQSLVSDPAFLSALDGWQVFHQCGTYPVAALQAAYDRAKVRAKVSAYCDHMGAAWRAADLAISRAGAGSVAEVWANGVPTIFLPNPFHDDGHQRKNVQPLLELQGARIIDDSNDPAINHTRLAPELSALLRDDAKRQSMREALLARVPNDGAQTLASWCAQALQVSV